MATRPILTTLKTTASNNHMVCIHPGALKASCYETLASKIDANLHVIDLQMIQAYLFAALDPTVKTSVEEIAEICRVEILKLDLPQGWMLAGWSFGGVISFEVASRLRENGSEPRTLVLLDSIAPVPRYKLDPVKVKNSISVALKWFVMYMGAHRGKPIQIKGRHLKGAPREILLKRVLQASIDSGTLPPRTEYGGIKKLVDSFVAGLERNNNLTIPYFPKKYPGQIVLFRAHRGLLRTWFDFNLGWSALTTQKVIRHRTPGDHYSMLTDTQHAEQLACALEKMIKNQNTKPATSLQVQVSH